MTKSYEQKYTHFIQEHVLCDFQQSIAWGKVKKYWKNEVILVLDRNNEIIASASVLIRKVPLFGNLMYIPRGPIGDIQDKEILKRLTEKIHKLAKQYHAFGIRIEPNIEKQDKQFEEMVKSLGYHVYSKAVNFKQEIQARHNFRLSIAGRSKEEILQSFEPKTRYNIRLAIKKNVVVKEEKKEGLHTFYQLLEETGERDHFRIRNEEYFETIWEQFEPENIKLLTAYYQNKPIASILLVIFGRKMWYLYGASSNQNRNVMPNYLLQWTAICYAIEQNLEVYDFRGVSLAKDGKPDGLYRFKKGFGTEFVELIGEIYIPFKPIRYYAYKWAEKSFRILRGFPYDKKHEKKIGESKKEKQEVEAKLLTNS